MSMIDMRISGFFALVFATCLSHCAAQVRQDKIDYYKILFKDSRILRELTLEERNQLAEELLVLDGADAQYTHSYVKEAHAEGTNVNLHVVPWNGTYLMDTPEKTFFKATTADARTRPVYYEGMLPGDSVWAYNIYRGLFQPLLNIPVSDEARQVEKYVPLAVKGLNENLSEQEVDELKGAIVWIQNNPVMHPKLHYIVDLVITSYLHQTGDTDFFVSMIDQAEGKSVPWGAMAMALESIDSTTSLSRTGVTYAEEILNRSTGPAQTRSVWEGMVTTYLVNNLEHQEVRLYSKQLLASPEDSSLRNMTNYLRLGKAYLSAYDDPDVRIVFKNLGSQFFEVGSIRPRNDARQ